MGVSWSISNSAREPIKADALCSRSERWSEIIEERKKGGSVETIKIMPWRPLLNYP